MVINFGNFGGGGGSQSGYTLPIATSEILGGVMIGDGINVDSAGTISVEGGGQGIEIVTELPESGTDGQTVMLVIQHPEKIVNVSTTTASSNVYGSVSAVGLTNKTRVFTIKISHMLYDTYVKSDNSISVECQNDTSLRWSADVGDENVVFGLKMNASTYNCTVSVYNDGFVFDIDRGWGQTIEINNILNLYQAPIEEEVLYTWSNLPLLTADIDYTTASGRNESWCVRWKYSEIPEGKELLCTQYYSYDKYGHLKYENGELHHYKNTSSAATSVTSADTYSVIGQYSIVDIGGGDITSFTRCYWTDDEIIVFSPNDKNDGRIYFNIDDFYKVGWHKDVEHNTNNRAFYKDYTFFDGDYGIIIKNPDYNMYAVGVKINPNSQYNTPFTIYSNTNSTIGPIFAPTTTGTTGYVCVAGNGWAAPTWVSPETITNGVKFWKGTQSQYDALSGTTGYDASTMYIIIPD